MLNLDLFQPKNHIWHININLIFFGSFLLFYCKGPICEKHDITVKKERCIVCQWDICDNCFTSNDHTCKYVIKTQVQKGKEYITTYENNKPYDEKQLDNTIIPHDERPNNIMTAGNEILVILPDKRTADDQIEKNN